MYGFGELASEYKPNITKQSASNFLYNLIKSDNELLENLLKVKYHSGLRNLSPAMVEVIVNYLGEPY